MSDRTLGALRWVAVAALGAALLAVAWPEAARPILSLLAAALLALLTVIAVAAVRRRLPEAPESSPFRQPVRRTDEVLPSELRRITHGMKGLQPKAVIPEPTYWALRRAAYDRLVLRHGIAIVQPDQRGRLAATISPTLLGVLTVDSGANPIRGRDLPTLISEVEQL